MQACVWGGSKVASSAAALNMEQVRINTSVVSAVACTEPAKEVLVSA
jgi:hypothetical protein